jgi:phospholipid/cholesterol/gamma-HCH transport system permease protein
MEIVPQIGAGTIDGLSYLGSLVILGARAAYYTLVAAFRGKPLRLERAISQPMEVGVRCLPILSLITFFNIAASMK